MATRTETKGLLSINAIEAVPKAVEEVRKMAENEKRERDEYTGQKKPPVRLRGN